MELSSERATRLVRLHLDSDEGTYHEVRHLVAEAIAEATPSDLSVEIVGAEIALQRARQQAVAGALAGLSVEIVGAEIALQRARQQAVAGALAGLSVEIVGAEIALQRARQQAVAGALAGLVEDLACGPDIDSDALSLLALDLLTAALGVVDFDELAADYLAIADEEL